MRSITLARIRRIAIPLAAVAAAGCASATEPAAPTVAVRREAWTGAKLTSYSYDYEVTGYFIAFAGHWIRIVVRDGAVQSATDLTTGQAEPAASLAWWPTVDGLFARAADAAAAGELKAVEYDPTYGYPTVITVGGVPDASGTTYAKNLVPAP